MMLATFCSFGEHASSCSGVGRADYLHEFHCFPERDVPHVARNAITQLYKEQSYKGNKSDLMHMLAIQACEEIYG